MKFGRAPTTCRIFRSRAPGAAFSLEDEVTGSDHSRLKPSSLGADGHFIGLRSTSGETATNAGLPVPVSASITSLSESQELSCGAAGVRQNNLYPGLFTQ